MICKVSKSTSKAKHRKKVINIPLRAITAKAIPLADATEEILKNAMNSATKVYNGLLWHLREEYKETGKSTVTRKNLNRN